eukprot:TRINITY_DN1970_c0_g2_i1.p1 TRINITY_DN1970_c0_g2~~TRINITY_DN1970_c0_g2_i1.p1  ORF type:complete len:360 (-),score=70.01 TRINITY_DN1970_c0_g2_i1:1832-2911(-)
MADVAETVQMENLTLDDVKPEKVVEEHDVQVEEAEDVAPKDVDDMVTKEVMIEKKVEPEEAVGESTPQKLSISQPDIVSMTPDPSPAVRPMSPTSSIAKSEYSAVAASEPPLPRDRAEDDDEAMAPTTPRSNTSGRITPVKQSALADRFLAAASNGSFKERQSNDSKDSASSAQVKNLASTFGTDSAAQQEKQRKLDQLRGGKFKTVSKKWSPTGSQSAKMQRVEEESSESKDKGGVEAEHVSSVSAMKKNWELGKAATFNDRQSFNKANEKPKAQGGFGDLMNRFKVIEGTEKSDSQKVREHRAAITSKAAMFETNVKKPAGKPIPKPGTKHTPAKNTDASEPAPNSIRGRAAMFEKK